VFANEKFSKQIDLSQDQIVLYLYLYFIIKYYG